MIKFNDPQVWVAIAFLLFILLCGKHLWKIISSFLNGKIEEIKNEISEANKLHNEAKNLLAKENKKIQDLDNQIKNILENAKYKSEELLKINKNKIDNEITKLEKASLDKIDYMEKKIINDLKFKIAEESVKISEDFLKKQIDNNSQQESINESLKEIQNSLKSKQDFI